MSTHSRPQEPAPSPKRQRPSYLNALARLPQPQRFAIYVASLALASADGTLDEDAVEVLYRLLDLRGIEGVEARQAHSQLLHDRGLREYLVPLALLDDAARLECLFLLTEIAHADDRVTEKERAILAEVQLVLGLQDEQFRALQAFVAMARALRHRGVAQFVAENILRRAQVRLRAAGIRMGSSPVRRPVWQRAWPRIAMGVLFALLVLLIGQRLVVAAVVGLLVSLLGVLTLRRPRALPLLSLVQVGHRRGLLLNLERAIDSLTSVLDSELQRSQRTEAENKTIAAITQHRDLLITLRAKHGKGSNSPSMLLTSTISVPGIQLDAPQGPKLSYKQVRKQLLDADVLLFRGNRPISRMLQVGARSSYSHCGLVAWWHRRAMLLHAESACIQAVPLSMALHSYPGEVDWYQIRADVRDPATVLRIIEEAQVNLGLSYAHSDLLRTILNDVAGMELPQDCEEPRALFCSQYVARCFRRADLPLHPQSDIETFPSEIALSPVLKFVGTIVPDLNPAEMRALLDRSRAW